MAEADTFHDIFIDELRDTYDPEKQLTKALPKLAKASSHATLRQVFEKQNLGLGVMPSGDAITGPADTPLPEAD